MRSTTGTEDRAGGVEPLSDVLARCVPRPGDPYARDERAAIYEFDAGMTLAEAEREADEQERQNGQGNTGRCCQNQV